MYVLRQCTESDTAGEVRGSLKTAQIRAVFRAFSTLINC